MVLWGICIYKGTDPNRQLIEGEVYDIVGTSSDQFQIQFEDGSEEWLNKSWFIPDTSEKFIPLINNLALVDYLAAEEKRNNRTN